MPIRNLLIPPMLNSVYPSRIETRQYNSDFSEKFDKSKNKLIYAAIFSITVGLFALSESGSFLGLKLEGLSDRRLEWMAWLGTVFFFSNTIFRFLDERRTVDRYKDEVASLEREFGVILQRLRDIEREISERLSSSGRFEQDVRRMKSRVGRFESSLETYLQDQPEIQKVFAEFQYSLDKMNKEIALISSRNNSTLFAVGEIPARLDQFERKTKSVKEYRNIGGFRFLIFDLMTPILLFFFATLVHFSSGFENLVLNLVPIEISSEISSLKS